MHAGTLLLRELYAITGLLRLGGAALLLRLSLSAALGALLLGLGLRGTLGALVPGLTLSGALALLLGLRLLRALGALGLILGGTLAFWFGRFLTRRFFAGLRSGLLLRSLLLASAQRPGRERVRARRPYCPKV